MLKIVDIGIFATPINYGELIKVQTMAKLDFINNNIKIFTEQTNSSKRKVTIIQGRTTVLGERRRGGWQSGIEKVP